MRAAALLIAAFLLVLPTLAGAQVGLPPGLPR